MADRKKRRAKNETPSDKLTKEEDSIARFIRFNCPTNSTVFEGNEVHYFSGKKAVDLLVQSKKYGAAAKNSKFPTQMVAEDFLRGLLERGFFFRAKKVVLKKKDRGKTDGDKKKDANKSPKSPKISKKDKEAPVDVQEEKMKDEVQDEDDETKKLVDQPELEKKKKKKIKLLVHDQQLLMLDPSDVYVWVFDPTPFYKKVIGFLIVLGTIAGCLFPLWPDWLRLVIYYLSVTGIALFGLLLGVALLRTILFGIIWTFTLGRHKLWVLPNLTEDCGFFDSFKPFYTYEYVPGGAFGGSATSDESGSGKKKKKSLKEEKRKKEAVQDVREENEVKSMKRANNKNNKDDEELPAEQKVDEDYKKKRRDDKDASSANDSDDDEAEEDENHPSDELSDESNNQSSGKSDNGEADGDRSSPPSVNISQLRQMSTNKKAQKNMSTEESGNSSATPPPGAEDDFVIVDSNVPAAQSVPTSSNSSTR